MKHLFSKLTLEQWAKFGVGATLLITGLVCIAIGSGWLTAVGVFLVVWGNNR